MDVHFLKSKIKLLEETTSRCFYALEKEEFSLLNTLLKKREQLQQEILDFLSEKYNLEEVEPEFKKWFTAKIKKLTKDNHLLVDNIYRRKKEVVEQLKQLRKGEKSLSILKEKIREKKVISKLI